MLLSLAVHIAAGAVVLGLGPTHDPAAEADPPPDFAGETFEIPELDPDRAEESMASSPAAAQPSPVRAPRAARAEPEVRGAPRPTFNAEATTSKAAASDAPAPPLFGAVGERGVADLATAFTRAFPQAASGDASWTQVPFGSAGTADVALEIDDTGHLVDTHVGGNPSQALRDGIQRALVLIRARSFVATAAVTRLHIVSTVSPDSVHDGLHGDVFAIGGSFAGREGSAFFALAIGRRIDLTITRK